MGERKRTTTYNHHPSVLYQGEREKDGSSLKSVSQSRDTVEVTQWEKQRRLLYTHTECEEERDRERERERGHIYHRWNINSFSLSLSHAPTNMYVKHLFFASLSSFATLFLMHISKHTFSSNTSLPVCILPSLHIYIYTIHPSTMLTIVIPFQLTEGRWVFVWNIELKETPTARPLVL